jgi:glycerophosphoryl diester phosphodiesterase
MPPISPLVHAHRGDPLRYPENTVAGFAAAIGDGADFIELDIGVTRDGALAVSHDPWLKPDAALLAQLSLDEVRRRGCPSLDEVFALAPLGPFGFNIEVKSFPDHPEYAPAPEAFARLLLASITRHNVDARCLVQSFDFRVLRAAAHLAPALPLAALWDGEPLPYEQIARDAGANAASVAFSLLTPARVEAAHAAGVRVLVWTVNGAFAWDAALDAGVDGIITDDAAGLVAHLEQRGLRVPSGSAPGLF